MDNSTVRAVNRLAKRWAAQAPVKDAGTVFTAAGVWPLLALLADGSAGPARAELAEALGIPAQAAAEAARELLAGLGGVRGLQAATGLWTKDELPLKEDWSAKLPAGTRGRLTGDEDTDREALDRWARDRTDGLIDRMPVALPEGDEEAKLILASALALRLRWEHPFRELNGQAGQGPWAGRNVPWLSRTTPSLDDVRVARGTAGAVTVLEVAGTDDVDVHLLLGEPAAPADQVLETGIAAVTGTAPPVTGSSLPEGDPGPGLTVRTVDSYAPQPQLRVDTVAFSLHAEHDLLEHAPLFGLETAADADHGHFPGISPVPLAIGAARQSVLARFHAAGFEAAAVTAVRAGFGGAAPRAKYRARRAEVRFDRPFGFLAVHRTSRLVLAAGWVAEPGTVGG
ncbi:serpin family protein [Streptomyces sp. NBC_00190]|uniref:serpin family protein n=1 Tax=unclassified Streptomyces TaxID=2593676 RepID=UPI002E2ABBA7|nr:serpin family protein [Streptomyces sp. NBC_00190]WSZ44005.1 serpin family protein [Streptomyces sp. NBC_00868]